MVKLLIDHLKPVEGWFYTSLGRSISVFALRVSSPLRCGPSEVSVESLRCLPSPSNFRLQVLFRCCTQQWKSLLCFFGLLGVFHQSLAFAFMVQGWAKELRGIYTQVLGLPFVTHLFLWFPLLISNCWQLWTSSVDTSLKPIRLQGFARASHGLDSVLRGNAV